MTTLTGKTESELRTLLNEKRATLRTFRFGVTGSRTHDIKEGRTTRKEIARILTELTARSKKHV